MAILVVCVCVCVYIYIINIQPFRVQYMPAFHKG